MRTHGDILNYPLGAMPTWHKNQLFYRYHIILDFPILLEYLIGIFLVFQYYIVGRPHAGFRVGLVVTRIWLVGSGPSRHDSCMVWYVVS